MICWYRSSVGGFAADSGILVSLHDHIDSDYLLDLARKGRVIMPCIPIDTANCQSIDVAVDYAKFTASPIIQQTLFTENGGHPDIIAYGSMTK